MKRVLKKIVSVLSWIILIFALIATILAFSADRSGGVPNIFGFIPLTVESDSMAPTFSANDLIIDTEITDVNTLCENDVITFWTLINGQKVMNTHRITEVHRINGNISFTTKGDNNSVKDSINVYPSDIVGKWNGVVIPGFGAVINFLRTQLGFCICVIVPLALFFLFELYKFIMAVVEVKRPAAQQLDEEEIKRRAIEEYLAEQQKKAENAEENKAAEASGNDNSPEENTAEETDGKENTAEEKNPAEASGNDDTAHTDGENNSEEKTLTD